MLRKLKVARARIFPCSGLKLGRHKKPAQAILAPGRNQIDFCTCSPSREDEQGYSTTASTVESRAPCPRHTRLSLAKESNSLSRAHTCVRALRSNGSLRKPLRSLSSMTGSCCSGQRRSSSEEKAATNISFSVKNIRSQDLTTHKRTRTKEYVKQKKKRRAALMLVMEEVETKSRPATEKSTLTASNLRETVLKLLEGHDAFVFGE